MAHGVKYRLQYYRLSGGLTTIDILQRGYDPASGITTLLGGVSPFESSWEGNPSNIYIPTLGTGAVLSIINETPLSLLELYTADPQEWMVQVWDGITDDDSDASSDSGGHLRWQGFISPEIFSEGYSNPIASQMTIQCNDGMQILDTIEYSNNGTKYTGKQTIGQIITNILSKLEIEFRTIYMANDLKITSTDTNIFSYLSLFNENFIDESEQAMSCRQVLNSIIGGLGGFTMFFDGYDIYIIDPINLHDTTKGKSYSTHTFAESTTAVGGFLDIAANSIKWGKTGSNLDVIPAVSKAIVKYDPYNFSQLSFVFSKEENWTTVGSFVGQDGNAWYLNATIEYKDWAADAGIQIAMKEDTYTAPEFVLQLADSKGEASYTFLRGVLVEDDSLCLRVSMQVFLQTKLDNANIFGLTTGSKIQRLKIPIAVKIGSLYWKGGTTWEATDTNKWQEWWIVGSVLWGNYLTATINDTWVNASIDVPVWDLDPQLLEGAVTIEFLDDMSTEFSDQLTPNTAAIFSDTTAAASNSQGGTGVTWARVTDSIIEITIVGLKTHSSIEARRTLFNSGVTGINTTVPSGLLLSGVWHDSSHNATAFSATVADSVFTFMSYTASSDTLVYRVTTIGTPFFGVGYDHIESGTITNMTYDYNYLAVRAFIKDLMVGIVDSQSRLIKENNVKLETAVMSTNLIGQKPKDLFTTAGTGPYGNSRGAFKSSQITPAGANITGLYRGAGSTYYSNAKLLLQSFMSQYKEPRIMLNAKFHTLGQAYALRTKLIKDTNHLSTRAFYMISGTYKDKEEIVDVTLLEIEDTRESIA